MTRPLPIATPAPGSAPRLKALASDVTAAADRALDRIFPARSVKKVLLVHPPDTSSNLFDFATCQRRCYTHYPPFGLMSLASQLRAIGVEVKIVDVNSAVFVACQSAARSEDFDYEKTCQATLAEALQSFSPDLVGVGCMFSYSHPSFAAICNEVARQSPEVPIIIGGVHVTNSMTSPQTAEAFFEELDCVDLIGLYENDISFANLVQVINRNQPAETLSQLIIRGDDADITVPERRAPTAEETNLLPAFDLLDLGSYAERGAIGNFYYLKENTKSTATLISNRGCRAQCTFCSVRNFNGMGVRRKAQTKVVDELLHLREHHGIDHVMWLDDDFFYDHKATIALFDEMIRRNVGMTWDCSNGVLAASCKDEILDGASKSGCIGLHIGVESGNDEILKQVRKPATVDIYLKAGEVLRKYEQIYTRVLLMIGFPGETFGQIYDSVKLAEAMKQDWNTINVVEPLPNTPMWNALMADSPAQKIDFESIQYITNPVKFEKSGGTTKTGSHMSLGFNDIFENCDMNAVPTREELVRIRAFMDFQLNFMPVLRETRRTKLEQKRRHFSHILRVVAPGNAVAMYFLGQVQRLLNGTADAGLVTQLEKTVHEYPVWAQQFDTLSLSVTHLRNLTP